MAVLGTCGHVDHGKSSLLRALTEMEPDRLPEEKKRGMTIDLGFVWLTRPDGTRIGIVDVPGHQRFVKNMISGTINVDAFLFIVAADDGWMPQSQEHLDILQSLGVERGLVAITKTDLVDEERADAVAAQVQEKLAGAFGRIFPIVPFSITRPETLAPLQAAVENLLSELPAARDTGNGRLWIDRVFLPRGQGVVATGTLREGALQEGDEVYLWPSGTVAQVKSMQAYHQGVTAAAPVSRVALGLTKVEAREVERGMLLTTSALPSLTSSADVRVRFFKRPITKNVHVSFHLGTGRELALAIPLGEAFPDEFFFRLKFSSPLPLRAGDRFVLRTAGEDDSLGAGIVADTLAATSAHREALAGLQVWNAEPSGMVAMESLRRLLVIPEEIANRAVHTRAELEAAVGGESWFAVQPGIYVDKTVWKKAALSLQMTLAKAFSEKTEPVAAKALRKAWQTACGLPGQFLDSVLALSAARGEIRRQGEGYLPLAADPTARARQQKAREWLTKSGGEPASFKEAPAEIKKGARELAASGEWIALAEEYFWEASAYAFIREKVVAFLTEKGKATTSDLKNRLGLSRKFAVLLFEQLDRDRVTFFKEGIRRLLKASP